MKNFQQGDNKSGNFQGGSGGGKPPFQKKSWGVDKGGGRDKVMFKAICSECGKNCEVPFRPSGDKPVYCQDCFNRKRDASDTRGRSSRPDFSNRAPKRDFTDRPSFRSNFQPDLKPAPAHDDTKKQLVEINIKLDRLLGAMEKMTGTKKETPALEASSARIAPKKEIEPKVSKKSKKKAVVKKKK
ncbi:MAG: CxxC-x17-CxxC domain-containing protein [Patescibacteria group bacterium]